MWIYLSILIVNFTYISYLFLNSTINKIYNKKTVSRYYHDDKNMKKTL